MDRGALRRTAGRGDTGGEPRRHVVHVAELLPEQAAPLGPLLKRSAEVVTELTDPAQVYVTLWSPAGGVPVHIHFVIQPVTPKDMAAHGGKYGPTLQMAMFDARVEPPASEVEEFAARARVRFDPSEPQA